MSIKRIIGYSFVTLVLTGCALWPSMFDANEHARIVNIHVASIDDSVCNDRSKAAVLATQMYQDARWAWHYGQFLSDNEKMAKMESDLMHMTRELHDRYEKPEPVSVFYCKSKFENIRRATDTIIKVSARRPRS